LARRPAIPFSGEGGDGIRLSQFTNLLSPQKRVNLDTLGNFKFTDHFAAFAEGWFSEEHATNLIAQPAYNTNLFGGAGTVSGNFVMSVNNPFLSAADRTTIQNALNAYGAAVPPGSRADRNWNNSHFYVSRASTDLQSGAAVVDQVVTRGVLGINGDFALGTRSYNWEIATNYGYSRDNQSHAAIRLPERAERAQCNPRCLGKYRLRRQPGQLADRDRLSHVRAVEHFRAGVPERRGACIHHTRRAGEIDRYSAGRDRQHQWRTWSSCPLASWKAAVGYENRRETAEFRPDTFYTTSAGQSVASARLGRIPHQRVLRRNADSDLRAAAGDSGAASGRAGRRGRRVNNSIAGNSTTWTKGLRWSPIQDVQFRGNRTHSIRAPAVTELFLPASTAFEFANDPCDKNYVGQGTAPATRAKNCAAAGIKHQYLRVNVVNATAQGPHLG